LVINVDKILAISVIFLLSSCKFKDENKGITALTPRVLLLCLDGLRPDQLDIARTPNLDQLIAKGTRFSKATNIWSEFEPYSGDSAPNWSALLTGFLPDKTLAYTNDTISQSVIGDNGHVYNEIPTIFGLLKSRGVVNETGVFSSWKGFSAETGMLLSNSTNVISSIMNSPLGSGEERDAQTLAHALSFVIQPQPSLSLVHFVSIDKAGHTYGFTSSEALDAIESIDIRVGKLMQTISNRSDRINEKWLTIVVSDHGGVGFYHENNNEELTRNISLIINGDGVVENSELNGTLIDIVPTILNWFEVSDPTLKGSSLIDS